MKPATDPSPPPPSRPHRSRLVLHLAVVLVVKIILLTLLWHVFIKPYKVKIDEDAMGDRIAAGRPSATSSIPTSPGDSK
jgi:hypothetical protein